jgi:acetaldehyde dehydrogenase (acetylating)
MAAAAASQSQLTDLDRVSVEEAGTLARAARRAQAQLAELSQDQIDNIVEAMAEAVTPHAEALARLAVEETGYGVVADKVQKNLFASTRVREFIRPMKTVGVVARHIDRRIVEIAEPFGVVAAIVPSTNPTSTAIYKALIAVKARCAIVVSPHPSAARCIIRTMEILAEAASRAGAPDATLGWLRTVTLEGTQALMRQREIAVILATGGMGLVRAAYSAGKPAYGVGPGNAPCYIERSADVRKAAADIIAGKTFDNGVLCSSPNSVVVDEEIAEEAMREFVAQGAAFLDRAACDRLAAALVTSQRLPNPKLVGKSAQYIAQEVGLAVPAGTRVLIAPLTGVGRDYPLSIEKLCPILSFYVVRDWREGCERCKEILKYGGMGHTMSIHSETESIVLEFGLKKPAFRICVNTSTTHGSIGLSTGLDPAMTLGCGGWGGNSTSDNITPRHLLNIKRLAYELHPVVTTDTPHESAIARDTDTVADLPAFRFQAGEASVGASALSDQIDRFLSTRGFARPLDRGLPGEPPLMPEPALTPVGFVCEEDVRIALRDGQTILIHDRTIVTPAARDLGESARILVNTAGLSTERLS